MSDDLNEVVGTLYAAALYEWADKAFESGDFTARPFADVTSSDEIAIGAMINLDGRDASKITQTGLDVIMNTLTLALKNEENSHARSQ